MVFSNFTRTASGNTITFRNSTPIENVGNLKFYKDNASGSFTKKEFRWSFNKTYWASWETLNQGNLTNVDVKGNQYLFFEIRYIVSGSSAVTTFSINYIKAATTGSGITCDLPTDYNDTCVDGEIINAQTLCGRPCDYYLWRPNHKGAQPISSITDLQTILTDLAGGIQNSITNASNVPGGIGVFYQKQSQSLVFKSIDVSGGISISESSGIITLSVDISTSQDSSINELYDFYYSLEASLYDISIYIENKFVQVDASLNYLYSAIGDTSVRDITNVGTGTGEIFKQINAGVAELRTITGLGDVSVYTQGDQIAIFIDTSGDSYQNSNPTNVAVGGIPDASTFFASEKTFSETMEAMFYPTEYPTLTAPSSGFSDNVSNLQEIADSINIQFTGTFSRGSINPQYNADSPYRSGLGNTVYMSGPSLDLSIGSYPATPYNHTLNNYDVSIGTQTWNSHWDYDAGVQPFDSAGNPYDSSLAAGSTSSNSVSFEGVYPLFGTTVNIAIMTKQSLVSMLSANNIVFSMVPESGGNKQAFEIPNAWTSSPTNRPLTGVETYNTVSLTWEYEGGTAITSLTYWTTSVTIRTIQSDPSVNYTKYTYNGPDRSAIQIRLNF